MVSLHQALRARTGWVAGAATSALLLAAAVVPVASAAPITDVHDFTDGDQGWFTYANTGTGTGDAVDGEFCSVVEGGDNPWDIAAQHDGITYDRNATYTVSFDARASLPLSIPMQGGAGYPAAFQHTLTLDGTSTPQPVTFEFSPAQWPTSAQDPQSTLAPEWTTTTGEISFQLGKQAQGYTFCIDNFSVTSTQSPTEPEPAEQIVGGDFEDGTIAPFYATGTGVAATVTDGVLQAALEGGTAQRWDQIIGFNGIVLEPGETYTISFRASASPDRTIRMVIGDDEEPYGVLFEKNPALGSEMKTYSYTFTATAAFPGAPAKTPGLGELSFQVGGADEPWTFSLDDVSVLSGTVAGPFVPETGPRVRVNQVGYLPAGPKQATLVTDETDPVAWTLRSAAGVAATGMTVPAGVDPTAGVNVHELDFSAVTTPGTYTLVADGEESYTFTIASDVYQQLRYDALNYFYPARSGIAIDGSVMVGQPDAEKFTRPAGHVSTPGSARNQGDVDVACLTPATEGEYWMYGDWACNYTADVTGGWYDAGDHGKYVVNGGIAVAQILSTYERTRFSPTGATADLGDGTLNIPLDESSNGIPDPLDEARWELEWMMAMQVPADADMYAGMVHHKVADADWTGLPLLPSDSTQERYLHRPSTAATLNFAAVAAQGARLWADYDEAFAEELLAAGQVAWDAAVATPDLYAPAPNDDPSPGSGPYDDDTVGDEFYWAAAELFLTTGDQEYQDHVLGSEYNTADIWTAGGFNWFETAALGRMDLATVESDIPGRDAIRRSVVDAAERYLAWQQGQPFGTAYPGADGIYDWGSNSAILNNQVVLGTAFDLTSDQRFADAVLESMDYLLGRNALNNSYITGYGHVYSKNQHSRWYSNSLEPSLPNPPRGSVSGGPNSSASTWDDVIKAMYTPEAMCAPQLCYVDDIQSWSTNEITVNWNSALSWVASFVADQGDGDRSGAGQVVQVLTHPADTTAVDGEPVSFVAEATGSSAPEVRWQRLEDGVWVDIAEETPATLTLAATTPTARATTPTTATLTLTATSADDGRSYRAVFANEFGGFYTDPAVLTVTPRAEVTPPGAQPPATDAPLTATPPAQTPPAQTVTAGNDRLPTTGAEMRRILLAGVLLLAAGGAVTLLTRRTRPE